MNNLFNIFSGIVIILVSIGFGISQTGIKKYFKYPQILRRPISEILNLYNLNRKKIRIYWTVFSFSSLMLIAVAGILPTRPCRS